MDSKRLFNIVLLDLTLEGVRLEQEMEEVVNSNMKIIEKTALIKSILAKMVENSASTLKFTTMINLDGKKTE